MKKAIGVLALAGIATLGAADALAQEAVPEDTNAITAGTIVYDDNHSDTLIEFEHNDLELAVEHITTEDYTGHRTMLGLRTGDLSGFELRQTGILDYGADLDSDGSDLEGAFNTNAFYTPPNTDLRFGVGGGASFPDKDWAAHGNLTYTGNVLHTSVDLLHHENGIYPIDSRGFASILLKNGFYLSLGKAEGANLFGITGYVGGPGEFNAMIKNWANYQDRSSRHTAMFTWNSTKGRGTYEFQNNLWTGPDGAWDLMGGAYDPTIGWAPMLAHYGEYGLLLGFRQNEAAMGGGALFAFNPGNRGNFLELGVDYNRLLADGDNDVTATLNLGTELGPISAMASIKQEVTEPETQFWIYFGHKFDL